MFRIGSTKTWNPECRNGSEIIETEMETETETELNISDRKLKDFTLHKVHRYFVISHVKLQNCHGNLLYVLVSRWRRTFKPGGGALGYFLGGYVLPGTPNWHPLLKKISPRIDTPF